MTSPTPPTEPEKKFTQADLDRVVADRLSRERAKFSDYDDLKKAAEAAAGSKSQLDKIQEQLTKAEERAAKAEREALRSSVAQELGLTPRQARKLEGATREEMLADGREMVEDFGIKKAGASTTGNDDDKGSEGGEGAANTAGDDDEGKQQEGQEGARPAPRSRPRELRSGAAMGAPSTEEMDPIKLAASVAKRY